MTESKSSDWIAIARILRPQGRRGEVLAELLTDQLSQFQAGGVVHLSDPTEPQAESREAILENHWLPVGKNAGRIVLKLRGVESISQAESLAGTEVTVSSAELPELDADTFYVKDLLGCMVLDSGRELGKVVDVQFVTSTDGKVRLHDAAPLLAIEISADQSGEPVLVPLVRAYLAGIDLPARRINMNLPPGLVETQGEPEPPELPAT